MHLFRHSITLERHGPYTAFIPRPPTLSAAKSRINLRCPFLLAYMFSSAVKVSDHGRNVMSSSLEPLKTRRVGKRCTLNLLRAQVSCLWYGMVVKKGDSSSGAVLVT
ncbi:hypothetical protein TNCV_3468431 [Trichonephila clavipes]|nr:hypothetical protein TNCV_3468431 [Trichonephila clavipes]